MNRKTRRAVIAILFSAVVVPLIVEAALGLFDPLGIVYFNDQAVLNSHVIPHAGRGYALEAGRYRLAHFTATELPGHARLLPDARNGPCLVVFVGDSLTWGYGVDDDQTWANRVARALSGTRAENPAFSGYNSENIRALVADYAQADVLVYLAISNDDDASWPTYARREQPQRAMLALYAEYVLSRPAPFPKDRARFVRDIQAFATDPRIVMVTFDNVWGRQLADFTPTHVIPHYTGRISAVDGHPNAAGHAEIAAAILPIVKDAVARRCAAII